MDIFSFFNWTLFQIGTYEFTVLNAVLVVLTLIAYQFMRRFKKQTTQRLFQRYVLSPSVQTKITQIGRYVLWGLTSLFFLGSIGISPSAFLGYIIVEIDGYHLTISSLLNAFIIIAAVNLSTWGIIEGLGTYYKKENIDIGTQYAINQLIRYLLYTIGILTAIQTLGINLTVIWGGVAALLVGFGLGMQQTFNDLISGLFLLVERHVHVGDTIQVGDFTGTVKRIGIRSTEVMTWDYVSVIVPNSKLVMESVINWSYKDHPKRFDLTVGVAYGSDTELVERLLLEVTNKHSKIQNDPPPFVRFKDFGDSSLNFEIHFWSSDFFKLEDTKSDLRFAIDKAFRKNNVTIPFPQRDLWIRNEQVHMNGGGVPVFQ